MKRNKNKRDCNFEAMRAFKRYVFKNMDIGLGGEHLKNWVEFSRKLACKTKKTDSEKEESEISLTRALLLSCGV